MEKIMSALVEAQKLILELVEQNAKLIEENSQLRNRTIWDKPRESEYVKTVRMATEAGEEG